MKFCEYIKKDAENAFLLKIQEMLTECFDLIKKTQVKRNNKYNKIVDLETRRDEIDKEEDEESYAKLEEQRRVLLDDIRDTEYHPDEDRVGEELSVSRAIDTITILLRFIQLLCENHNLALQNILNT